MTETEREDGEKASYARRMNGRGMYLRVLQRSEPSVKEVLTFAAHCTITWVADGAWVDFSVSKTNGMLLVLELSNPTRYQLRCLNKERLEHWILPVSSITNVVLHDSRQPENPDGKMIQIFTRKKTFLICFQKAEEANCIHQAITDLRNR